MARILVIDSESKSIDELKKTLLTINNHSSIEAFVSFYEFDEVCRKLTPEQEAEFYKFDLLILEYGLVGPPEWEKRIAFFKNKISKNLNLCFSSYDNANLNRKHLLQLKAKNIIYKPFDPLILKESLNMALKPGQIILPLEIKAQKTGAKVAMLKEVEITSICELGFVTINNGAIPAGSLSKYFSELFVNGKKQSAWAQCLISIPIPNRPGLFISKFQFFGLENSTLMGLRKYMQTNKHKRVTGSVWNMADSKKDRQINIAIVDSMPEEKNNPLRKDLETHFKNVNIKFFQLDPLIPNEKQDVKYDLVINLNIDIKTEDLLKVFSRESVFVGISRNSLKEDQLVKIAEMYKDIFYLPLDKSYLKKKLKTYIGDLNYKEPVELLNISTTEKIKATTMIQLNEICEVYLNFNYHREIELGSYREFAFIGEDENQIIELPGFCSFTQKAVPGPGITPGTFFHQFIFWGMTDHYLKQIRIWLLHNHIANNQNKVA